MFQLSQTIWHQRRAIEEVLELMNVQRSFGPFFRAVRGL